ncbi:MAG TPA: cell division protein FtsL [Terriglobales bacterium]|jgi:cell division protein FtsL|nr:cell division protein FtsL [Terriglobales bacterium]
MAAGALAGNPQIRSSWGTTLRPRPVSAPRPGTPEIYFAKAIDNSRLVKVADRERNREMVLFVASLCLLFLLVMVYAWQHFSAIEYGYKIEAQRTQRDSLVELNRTLRLEDASLRDPERIDTLARRMGLQTPQAGQVISLELPAGSTATPVLARAAAAPVVTVEQ